MRARDLSELPQAEATAAFVTVMSSGLKSFSSIDFVAEEIPIALEFNGIAQAVMLATPADLEDFALGFALSEGIIDTASQFFGAEIEPNNDGITVRVNIASSCFAKLKEKRRNMTGRTGCGLCGTESLNQVFRHIPSITNNQNILQAPLISSALKNLRSHQQLQQKTGATHAAAWFDEHGNLKLLREDVGRHNALDKLIGAGLRTNQTDWQHSMLLITSRASMEMVQKALVAGFNNLIAISAPTKMAINLAQQHGLCLIGFAKPEKWTIYSYPSRVSEAISTDHVAK